jgi:hypothetical protein
MSFTSRVSAHRKRLWLNKPSYINILLFTCSPEMARGQHMGSIISYPQPSLLCELRWLLVQVAQEVAPELIQKILIAGNQTSADQIAKGAGKGEI